ncbi:unnamed protein product [Orchesella dallaii]|uniref:Peptide transporter family 1 n=1 Tax=Orchesella dallaii TaxID=48710 RepID=A0ABP1PRT1_9HEXA
MKGEYNTKEKEKEEPAEKSHFDFDSQKGYGAAELESDKKLPYPKSVFFIITNEFCERFSYYGMKAVLSLFLINVLEYSEDKSTVIYHVFSMLCYFTPVFGAMIADSLLGKFKTILYLSIVYAIGNVVLSAAATPPLQIPQETFTMLGLLLIAIGTGGIKPCVSAFGGDQFVLPQQAMQLASFFSIFYFAINAGSLVSTLITPIFRKDVKCFDSETCYPLAFGVPAVLMVVSLIVFVIGKPWYNCRKPEGNITMDVGKCVTYAIKQKSKSKDRREHWLDHASGKYDSELIESIKRLLKILVLYIPLPVFWALFDQQGSR